MKKISILGFNIQIYLIFIVLGLILNFITALILSKKYQIKKNDIIKCCIFEIIGIVLGAKILDFVIYLNIYITYLVMNLDISTLIMIIINKGYIYYGGVFGGLVFIYLYSKIHNKSFEKLCGILIPNLILVYSLCKIGCYFNQCCNGIVIKDIRVPIQMIECIGSFIIYVVLLYNTTKKVETIRNIGLACILYSVLRFCTEFFRQANIENELNISITQVISIFVFIIGIKLIKN